MITMSENRSIIMIGGFDRYGSGKYMRDMSDSLARNKYQIVQISTNRMRLSGLLQMVRRLLTSSHNHVLFQPSISGMGFVRDAIILFIMRILGCQIAFVILSHIFYKNYVFKFAWMRSLFFKNRYVVGAADISEVNEKAREYAVITPIFSVPFSTHKRDDALGGEHLLFCYIGYFDAIKGFDRFVELASQHEDQRFLAIGDPLNEQTELPNVGKNIEYLVSSPESDFSNNVRQMIKRQDCLPVLLYSSRYDLAPFLILELGAARVPVCVMSDTDSHQILKNFLPQGAFFVFKKLADIVEAESSGKLSGCADTLEEFSLMQGQEQFDDKIEHFIGRWMRATV